MSTDNICTFDVSIEVQTEEFSSDDEDRTPEDALLASNHTLYEEPIARRRTFLREDSHFSSNVLAQEYYSKKLKFKRAIDGDIGYFQYWINYFQSNFNEKSKIIEEFKASESKCGEMTVLHYAAQHCRTEICEMLLTYFEFNANVKNSRGITPLHLTVKYNSRIRSSASTQELQYSPTRTNSLNNILISTMECLIQHNANIDEQDELGFTALHYAAMKDNLNAACYLIMFKAANCTLRDKQLMLPIHVACKYGSDNVFNILLEKETCFGLSRNEDKFFSLPLHYACSCKTENTDMVQKILDVIKSTDEATNSTNLISSLEKKNSKNKSPLHICIENGHTKLVEMLCKQYQADPNQPGGALDSYPIHMAAKVGSVEIMLILKDAQADLYKLNKKNENLLHVAASSKHYKFIFHVLTTESSMKLMTTTNYKQFTPLLSAAVYGNRECVAALLQRGNANLNDKDIDENNIFHLCTIYNNIETFKFLLESKYLNKEKFLANMKQCDKFENSVVHVACRIGNLEIIQLIFSCNLFDNSMTELVFLKNNKEQTGFHIACAKGHYNIVHFFLKKFNSSSLILDIDQDFNTGLHLASLHGHDSIVNLLINYNANIMSKNHKEWTPFDFCCYHGWVKTTKQFLTYYAPSDLGTDFTEINPLLLACENGKHEIVRLLLDNNANISTANIYGENCLDIALKHDHKFVVEAILDRNDWFEAIHEDSEKRYFQYKNLIFKMPNMFEMILDKIEEKKHVTNGYDFTQLDVENFTTIETHPLMMMSMSRQEQLLRHPVTQSLINLKWKRFPYYIYWTNLILYLAYVILFSAHVIISNKTHLHDLNTTNNTSSSANSEDVAHNILDQNKYVYIITLILLIFHILKELFQMINNRLEHFFRLDNNIELLTYALTLIFIVPMPPSICDNDHEIDNFELQSSRVILHRCTWQWQIGSISILLSWIVCVLFVEKVPVIGKYVVMFRKIFLNSFKFFPVFSLLIFGFALSFSMLLGDKHSDFESMETAIMKTLSMMIGELDFTEVFVEKSWANYVVYTIFVSIMCIIILNLLVGLAVGDISKVEKDAFVDAVSMEVDFILRIQKHFKKIFGPQFMVFKHSHVEENRSIFKRARSVLLRELCLPEDCSGVCSKICVRKKPKVDYRQDSSEDSQLDMIKYMDEFQHKMVKHFEMLALSMSKLKTETKLLKTQIRNNQEQMKDFRKSILRKRFISN